MAHDTVLTEDIRYGLDRHFQLKFCESNNTMQINQYLRIQLDLLSFVSYKLHKESQRFMVVQALTNNHSWYNIIDTAIQVKISV